MAKKKIEIKITGSVSAAPFLLSYHVGDVVKVNEELANDLIKAEMAEYASPAKVDANKTAEVDALKQEVFKKDEAIKALTAKVAELEGTNKDLLAKVAELEKVKVKPEPKQTK
jgi:hypothetical protein